MTADGWTSAVRHQLGLGRLLPLGGARDGAWITEEAAQTVLRGAVRELRGVRLGVLRVGPAGGTASGGDTAEAGEPVVPPPPSALPPGPLRVTADFAAGASEPLPAAAARLRTTLATASAERLGLVVTEVDLRVTELLDEEARAGAKREARVEAETQAQAEPPLPSAGPSAGGPSSAGAAPAGTGPAGTGPAGTGPAGTGPAGDEARAVAVALRVPGVTGTSGVLGRAVRIEELHGDGTAGAAALPRRHVRVEITVSADRRAVEVAREVRGAVSLALADRPTVAVLVTAVG
ncbi:nucleopolyhedrovirus P10 family protein [Streptomyces sp. NBC_01275]|uniref:nucleopolyhedrovirus P10 family protein n=1 Tax=Streptomyces sp. NBC_01275 TaxID=2903807 RepID=UPI00225236AE|nr:nucleopolyhedrovirus P10 family protein [Streptomyces sp. NBC_01275]MCX4761025.1 nucleopolyhedrovirus P10 family protein [Streptomyces sp. NBC_01275]